MLEKRVSVAKCMFENFCFGVMEPGRGERLKEGVMRGVRRNLIRRT